MVSNDLSKSEEEKQKKDKNNNKSRSVRKGDRDSLEIQSEYIDRMQKALVSFLRRVAFNEESPSKKTRLYPYAFEINEEIIRRIDARIKELFSELESNPLINLQFSGEVGFPDLSTQGYDNLNELINKGGEKKDPERLTLKWSLLLKNPPGTVLQIEMKFITEQRLETKELGFLDFDVANMHLFITGVSSIWVEHAFAELNPFFETVRISGIYKPLLIFRNRILVHILSLAAAVMAQYYFYGLITSLVNNKESQDIANLILNNSTLETKFDQYIRVLYTVSSPAFKPILVYGAAILIFVTILSLCLFLFPKLVPRSFISIGLAKIRFKKYQNAFKFIVFTILISGIIIPLIVSLVF